MELLSGSKTFIGIAIAAVPTVANIFGYQVGPEFSGQVAQAITDIIQIVGLSLAIYGRLVAQTPGWFAKQQ